MSLNYPNQVTSLTVIDFEFSTDGGSVSPISYVARVQDFDSIDRKPAYIYGWKPKVGSMEPYGTGDKDLLVTFFGEAEYWLMSHLGWKLSSLTSHPYPFQCSSTTYPLHPWMRS